LGKFGRTGQADECDSFQVNLPPVLEFRYLPLHVVFEINMAGTEDFWVMNFCFKADISRQAINSDL
jgi:hypothetical protein